MIRSGLMMAGGDHVWNGNAAVAGLEDGILTAYEVSQVNLSNTELVVLSACETGLGDIEGNEGVYGLQRAFKIAGAKNLIMSLWTVPDQQTQEMMVLFYNYWLGRIWSWKWRFELRSRRCVESMRGIIIGRFRPHSMNEHFGGGAPLSYQLYMDYGSDGIFLWCIDI